uniref:Uncharacterized protein n=1 Tax=Utricularia reniformis TaxID=192314 RepID=A0A1Y0AZ34_9LAMI|nr:hypothetical protein AEK19_MT1910 [Utricularia reniformis]ART30415.1 hypothetical protein AEK19_MT1910 [Utricularia reniformis]
MSLRVAGHVASFGGHAALPTTFSLAALACHSLSLGLVKAESAGSGLNPSLAVDTTSSALVAAASLSASDSDFDVGRNIDTSSEFACERASTEAYVLMQIRHPLPVEANC